MFCVFFLKNGAASSDVPTASFSLFFASTQHAHTAVTSRHVRRRKEIHTTALLCLRGVAQKCFEHRHIFSTKVCVGLQAPILSPTAPCPKADALSFAASGDAFGDQSSVLFIFCCSFSFYLMLRFKRSLLYQCVLRQALFCHLPF